MFPHSLYRSFLSLSLYPQQPLFISLSLLSALGNPIELNCHPSQNPLPTNREKEKEKKNDLKCTHAGQGKKDATCNRLATGD